MDKKIDLVVPILPKDFEAFEIGLKWVRTFIKVDEIIIIAQDSIKPMIDKYKDTYNMRFIEENELLKFSSVKNKIANLTDNDELSVKRAGWYYQQFLKMIYAETCRNEYYYIWDADTIPLHFVNLFENNHPIMHVRDEFNDDYYNTFEKLFPELHNHYEHSFITEHMLFNTNIMREIINKLRSDNKEFYETILDAIDKKVIPYSGFSEFETYGLYVTQKYYGLYMIEHWNSLRSGAYFFNKELFGESEINWIGKEYDAVSYEKNAVPFKMQKTIFHNRIIQKLFSFHDTNNFVHKLLMYKKKWENT